MERYVLSPYPASAVDHFEETKQRLTQYATDMIAGEFISHKDFPKRSTLPRFFPLPFNNFGHSYLFDNKRFLHIIYQTITELKELNPSGLTYKNRSLLWSFLSLITSAALICLLISVDFIIYSLFIAIGVFYLADFLYNRALNKKLANHKVSIIEKLLKQEWEINADLVLPEKLQKSFKQCGDGDISKINPPILVMYANDRPFPGFGSLQYDNKFICRPKNLSLTHEKEEKDLVHAISGKIKESLKASGLKNLGFGKVIVVSYDSLSINSSWLDCDKSPFLNKELNEGEDPNGMDEFASTREYFSVEILFPEYDSAACFFIRPFKASNSAGCHVAITTLGPPMKTDQYLRARLMKYRFGKSPNNKKMARKFIADLKNTYETELAYIVKNYEEKFHENIGSSWLKALDPLEEMDYDQSRIDKRIDEIKKIDDSWPGKYYFTKYNIRETHSLALGGDFFGYPELNGSVSTIYDQLSRMILTAIEEQGYDISDYKDKDGKLVVNAESIDKLFVGEVINMKTSDDGDKKENLKPKK